MAFEHSITGFTTDVLVAEMHQAMARQMASLPLGEVVTAAFLLPEPDAPSISYGVEVLRQGDMSPRVKGEVWIPTAGEYELVDDITKLRHIRDTGAHAPARPGATREIIQDFNMRRLTGLDGAVPLTVTNETAGLHPKLDVDGTVPGSLHIPATPVGMVTTANHVRRVLGQGPIASLKPEEVVVLGNGGVGGPLVDKVLPSQKRSDMLNHPGIVLPKGNHYKGREHLPAGAERLATDTAIRVGFTATRAYGNVTTLTPDTLLIDVGYAVDPVTGREGGNAHPDLLAQNGKDGKVILAFRGGGGPVTIATVYDRAVDNHLSRR